MDKINMLADYSYIRINLSKITAILFFSISIICFGISLFCNPLVVVALIMLFSSFCVLYAYLYGKKRDGRKIIFRDGFIQILDYNEKLLYEIEMNSIVTVKKMPVLVLENLGAPHEREFFVLFLGNDELGHLPEYRSYWDDRNYLFIQNREGIEDIITKYLVVTS